MNPMSTSDPLGRITWLHHFTDTRNIASIRKMGGLYSRHHLRSKGVENFHTGGNQWSLDADDMVGMDKYVHLCLRTNHALEHIAKQDGRIEKTVWLYIDAASVFKTKGVLYSYGVSNKSGMKICPIQEAAGDIDFQVLYTRTDWHDPEINARLSQAELCEILVPEHVPLKYFERYFPNG
jgi:hypothetical protein